MMKYLVFISLLFLIGCTTNPVNQTNKKESENKKTENTQTLPKDAWIYNTPWGKSTVR